MKVRPSPPFGDFIDFGFADASAIVVAVNDGYGLTPIKLLLPHQLYVEEVRALLAKHREVAVLPVGNAAKWTRVPAELVAEKTHAA